jgi:hypothetical protein
MTGRKRLAMTGRKGLAMTGWVELAMKKKESLFVTEIICYFEKSLSFFKGIKSSILLEFIGSFPSILIFIHLGEKFLH